MAGEVPSPCILRLGTLLEWLEAFARVLEALSQEEMISHEGEPPPRWIRSRHLLGVRSWTVEQNGEEQVLGARKLVERFTRGTGAKRLTLMWETGHSRGAPCHQRHPTQKSRSPAAI